jgi:hypothetical protein
MKSRARLASVLAPFFLLILAVILSPTATMVDGDDHENDDTDHTPPDTCAQPIIEIAPIPYLNGVPLAQADLEIVGDQVKVYVQKPPFCHTVTPAGLPFRWDVIGPDGLVTLTGANTRRPHFRPAAAGAYQVKLTFCPTNHTCPNVDVGSTTVSIPPTSVTFDFIVVNEIPLPPDTKPVRISWADEAEPGLVAANHAERRSKCGYPPFIHQDMSTPQLVPVSPWANQDYYQLLEGEVTGSNIAGVDNELNHSSHDAIFHVVPDRRFQKLKVPDEVIDGVTFHKEDMEVEWESDRFPGPMRPLPGDRISAFGFHTYDCHHDDDTFGILAEIHPAVLTAVHRRRPIRIPDGWQGLGNNIHVPGIVTDIWANRFAGEMTSNCSTTGLHQAAEMLTDPPFVRLGDCIRSPHPLDRQFNFRVYLPPDPRKRMATAGVSAPPVPLYHDVEGDPENRVTATESSWGGVTYLDVTVNLAGFTGDDYSARIIAGWVQPSPDNWGLQRWKVGIDTMEVFDDHDDAPTDDGDWIFWAAINNRDKEWTRLLHGGQSTHGTVTFGGCPFETVDEGQSPPCANHSLGPHLLLFHPSPIDFPGSPLEDSNRSFLIHTSGYDAEFWDDPTGLISHIERPGTIVPIGARSNRWRLSDTGDYLLGYSLVRLGPVPASLSAAGQALASAYSVDAQGARCISQPTLSCLIFPERFFEGRPWHPLQARMNARTPALDWRDFPAFEPQEREQLGLTGMSARDLSSSLAQTRARDPQRAERFVVELRQPYNRVRGTSMAAEFAKSLPWLESGVPMDLWQRHFGDIDPTPVDLAVSWVRISPAAPLAGQNVVVSARIVNRGTGGSVPFSVQSYLDRNAARAVNVPALAAGAGVTVSFPAWLATAGDHRVRVVADSPARIGEPVETNNARELGFVVAGGDR